MGTAVAGIDQYRDGLPARLAERKGENGGGVSVHEGPVDIEQPQVGVGVEVGIASTSNVALATVVAVFLPWVVEAVMMWPPSFAVMGTLKVALNVPPWSTWNVGMPIDVPSKRT